MAIITNLKSLAPRREVYKKEITLVSGGFYNQTAFPGGKITVYPWDNTIDEWFQTRLRQPKREYALWEVIEKVANMNGAKYTEMPVGDIMTVLMVARSIRSDCIIEYVSVCPACQHRMRDKLAVPAELSKIGEKKADYPGYDEFTLPDSKDVVRMRVLTVRDEMVIAERPEEDKKVMSDAEALVIAPIMSVGGGPPESIQEATIWYRALSPKDANFLARQRAVLAPQLDPDIAIECDSCKHEYKHTLDLQRDFFRVD
jgi:hypothetical protein